MKNLNVTLVKKIVEYKKKKFPTYFVKFIGKDNEVNYMDVTLQEEAKEIFDDNEEQNALSLSLRISESKEEYTNSNAFVTKKTKLGEDGEYHPVKNKDGKYIPKMVINKYLSEKDIIDSLEFPTKQVEDDGWDDELPF